MRGPHYMAKPDTFTHYSYLSGPGFREPTGLLNLEGCDENTRRTLIHNMIGNGELVAILPFREIKNMRQLRGALRWTEES